MSVQIKLTQTKGSEKGREYTFQTPDRYITIGRSRECTLQVMPDPDNVDVSRYHCRVELDPPLVLVRDLYSLNGTFLNDAKIGQRDPTRKQDESGRLSEQEFALETGDEIRLGSSTTFRVDIQAEEENELLSVAGIGNESESLEAIGAAAI